MTNPMPESVEITITRSGNLNNWADVELQLAGGNGEWMSDFEVYDPVSGIWGVPQMISFAPGETSKTLLVDLFNDGMVEGTETAQFQLVNTMSLPDLEIGGNDTTTVEILDLETTYIEFAQAKYSTVEFDFNNPFQQVELTLTRSGNLNNFADVELQLVGGSAQQYSDFDSPFGFPQLVSFASGEDSKTILIEIWDDFEIEGTETAMFELVNVFGNPDVEIGNQNTTTLEILDDETAQNQIIGNNGDDNLLGTQDDDLLNGGAGNDFLMGDAGDDILIAGDGNDILIGDVGKDHLFGGSGYDRFVFNYLGDKVDQISDFTPGEDTIEINAIGFGIAANSNPEDYFSFDSQNLFFEDTKLAILINEPALSIGSQIDII